MQPTITAGHPSILPMLILAAMAWAVPPDLEAAQPTLQTLAPDLPVTFEENVGQADPAVRFIVRGTPQPVYLTDRQLVIGIPTWETAPRSELSRQLISFIRLSFPGARSEAAIDTEEPLPTRSNFIRGASPHQRHGEARHYGRVRYRELYEGIDLVCYGNRGRLEFDLELKPGADPNVIRLKVDGSEQSRLDESGNLALTTSSGEVRLEIPAIYQESPAGRLNIAGSFRLDEAGHARFEVGRYDPGRSLYIDPLVVFSTYLGGSGFDEFLDLTLDSEGFLYLTGQTSSADYPLANPFQANLAGGRDVFITKIDPSGRTILFSTFVGGQGTDAGRAITVDGEGNIYVAGQTFSTDFPSTSGAFQTQCSGLCPFLFKMNRQGTSLLYSTFLGRGAGVGVAVDSAGQAILYGSTSELSFPTASPAQPQRGGGFDAFVSKFSASGSQLLFSTYLGGSGDENIIGIPRITVDPSGNIYVTGRTDSSDFPVLNPVQANAGGQRDAFVTKYSPAGVVLLSTYLGGSDDDDGIGIAADNAGNAYVAGVTRSPNFPVRNAFQSSFGGFSDAFLAKIPAAGGQTQFATYLGSTGADSANAVQLAENGEILVAGGAGTGFPLVKPLRVHSAAVAGGTFLARFAADGSTLPFSTLLGGPSAAALAVRGPLAYVGGKTTTRSHPLVKAFQPFFPGLQANNQSFITLINFSPRLYFAQVGNGGGIVSEILLSNPSSENTATAKIEFFAGDGSPMTLPFSSPPGQFSSIEVSVPPLGTAKVTTTGQGETRAGAARVTTNVGLGGVIRFLLPGAGIAGVGQGEPSASIITPVRRTAINTGIAFHNVMDDQISVRVTLRDAAGQQVQGGLTTIVLPPRGHQARFINEIFNNLNLNNFEGTLSLEASLGAIVATALELGGQPGQFTTLPVTPIP